MRHTAWRRGAGLLAGALTAVVMAAGPAAASCAPPPPMEQAIEDAKSVFVGTVQALADEGFHATVAVEEVWKGPDLPPTVEVRGSSGGSGPDSARTSVDRTYTQGTKYLFVLYDDQPPLEDNSCTNTSEWQEDYAQYRPADWRHPVSAPNDGAAGDGEMGITSVDEGEESAGDGDPDTPVTSDDMDGADDPNSLVHNPDAPGDGAEEVDTDPAAATGGIDDRLWLAIVIGAGALLLAARWLRRDA